MPTTEQAQWYVFQLSSLSSGEDLLKAVQAVTEAAGREPTSLTLNPHVDLPVRLRDAVQQARLTVLHSPSVLKWEAWLGFEERAA